MTLRKIFETAIEISDPSERSLFINRACHGQPELLQNVLYLIKNYETDDSFMEKPPASPKTLLQYGSSFQNYHLAEIDTADIDDPVEDYYKLFTPSELPDSLGLLGDFEIRHLCGQGGFAAVFKAIDTKLNRLVAVKILSPRLSKSSSQRKRFSREALALSGLKHRNVVNIYAVFEEPLPYMIMEFVDGWTLDELIKRDGRLGLPKILELARQLARGLAAIHEKGLIHRDIKPVNIMVENESGGTIRITDFGIARTIDDNNLTRTGLVAGTPMFMSPEQVKGSRLDKLTDMFSLGSVLYFLATGSPPFRGSNLYSIIRGVADHSPQPVSELNPDLPVWFDGIIRKLMDKEPEKRFQSAAELADLLDLCQNEWKENGRIASTSLRHRLNETLSEYVDKPVDQYGWRKFLSKKQQYPAKASFLLACLFLLVLVGGIYSSSWHGSWYYSLFSQPAKIQTLSEPVINFNQTQWSGWPKAIPAPAVAPFDTPTARKLQEIWSEYLKLPLQYTNSIGMEFILIPPGEFLMGSTPGEITEAQDRIDNFDHRANQLIQSEGPQHRVVITEPFYMGIHEVTRQQYVDVLSNDNPVPGPSGNGKTQELPPRFSRLPVDSICLYDAVAFCEKLSLKESRTPRYRTDGKAVSIVNGTGYRLPTEAEWEYSARAGTTTALWTGILNYDLTTADWFDKNSGTNFHDVGLLRANPFGLFDIQGNVSEWVQDGWRPDSYKRDSAKIAVNPTGEPITGLDQVMRGGRLNSYLHFCRIPIRDVVADASTRYAQSGFRVVLPINSSLISRGMHMNLNPGKID